MEITSDLPHDLCPPPHKPKVAIVSSVFMHYECIGFICEMYRHAEAIGIYYNGERFGWVPYFVNSAGFNNVFIGKYKNNIQDYLWKEYDIIIKLTSGDPIIDMNRPEIHSRYYEKMRAIMHAENYAMPEKYITISPLVKCEKPHNYILPVYRGLLTSSPSKQPMILYVGHIDKFDDDLRDFISRVNYKVVFCSPSHHRPVDFNHPNMVFFGDVATPHLIKLISECWFILGKNPRHCFMDRFSGAITLALSYKKPMIVARAVQDVYTFSFGGVVFDKYYCEVIDVLNDRALLGSPNDSVL